MLVPPKEPNIGSNNQSAMTDSTGMMHTLQALNTPTLQELIADTTKYIMMNANRTSHIIIRGGIHGSTPSSSVSGTSAVAICPSPNPPSVLICNSIIGNIG